MEEHKPNWYYAYDDYKAGMSMQDIAYKYAVSIYAVRQWKGRHWKTIDAQETKKEDSITKHIQDKVDSRTKIEDNYSTDTLPSITPKEKQFVQEYLLDMNMTAAAIRAGYSVATAGQEGNKLYNKPSINAHIQIALARRNVRVGISADMILQELARISFVDPSRVIDLNTARIKPDAPPDDLHAIASVKVKNSYDKQGNPVTEREVKFYDKTKAIELLAKHIGMLNTTSTVNVNHSIDLSKLSTQEIRQELDRQKQLLDTIDIQAIDTDKNI